MLTASDKPESLLQCSGHGSIVQTPFGKWYMAYLCTRPLDKTAAILGRETAIEEVYWTEDGWLRLASGGNGPSLLTEIVTNEKVVFKKATNFADDFTDALKKEWNTLRILADDSWCDLISRKGYLRMFSGDSIQSLFEHHILAIRQKDFDFQAETSVEFHPTTFNQMAGLMLYLNDSNYLYVYVTYDEEKGRVLRFMRCENGQFQLDPTITPITAEEVQLKVMGNGAIGNFYFRLEKEEEWKEITTSQDLLFLAGGFTGNFIGIAVHDMNKKAATYADFSYFRYEGLDSY